MRATNSSFKKSLAPLAKWGIGEYTVLAALWLLTSTPFLLNGWGAISFLSLPLLIAAILVVATRFSKAHPDKGQEKQEVLVSADGLHFTRQGSEEIEIKWCNVREIVYQWGPWYEDVFGGFPICEWKFITVDGRWTSIPDDNEVNTSILVEAIEKRFPGLICDYKYLQKLPYKELFVDGEFKCWPPNV